MWRVRRVRSGGAGAGERRRCAWVLAGGVCTGWGCLASAAFGPLGRLSSTLLGLDGWCGGTVLPRSWRRKDFLLVALRRCWGRWTVV